MIFVSDDIHAKIPRKLNYESKKIQILGENGINSKLKHRKAHNSILQGRFGDLYGRLGDRCCIWESWQVCNWLRSFQVLCFLADLPAIILPCQYSLVSMVTHYYRLTGPPELGKVLITGKKSLDSSNFLVERLTAGKSCKLQHLVITMMKPRDTEHFRKFRRHPGTWKIEITL